MRPELETLERYNPGLARQIRAEELERELALPRPAPFDRDAARLAEELSELVALVREALG